MTLEQTWRGLSGHSYDFQVYPSQSNWPYWGGIYLFCSRNQSGWTIHYIGECHNLSKALSADKNHSIHSSALNATHVHVLLESDPLHRHRMKKDLILALRPSFNAKLRISEKLSQVA